jgi:hypothetical protein
VVVGGLVVVVVVVDVLLVEATAVDLPEAPPQLLVSRHPARARPTWRRQRVGMAHLKGRDQFKRNHRSEGSRGWRPSCKPMTVRTTNLDPPIAVGRAA